MPGIVQDIGYDEFLPSEFLVFFFKRGQKSKQPIEMTCDECCDRDENSGLWGLRRRVHVPWESQKKLDMCVLVRKLTGCRKVTIKYSSHKNLGVSLSFISVRWVVQLKVALLHRFLQIPGPFSSIALISAFFLSAWTKLNCNYFDTHWGKEELWRSTYPVS